MNAIMDFIHAVPDPAWTILISAVVSMILQGIKKWLDVQSDKVITFILTALSFAGSAIEYYVSTASQNPTVLGQKTVVIVGSATLIYRYLIKPVTTMAQDAKTYRQTLEVQEPQQVTVFTPPVAQQPVSDFAE